VSNVCAKILRKSFQMKRCWWRKRHAVMLPKQTSL